jgi:hypothetical protein
VHVVTGPTPPTVVVGYQPVNALDPSGKIQAVLDAVYTQTPVDGIPVWRKNP